ncbi:homoserine kinase [soil metagenome]
MSEQFSRAPVTVRVPATSANIGPGFDAFGLALSRFDSVTASVLSGGLDIAAAGEGASSIPQDETHLIIRAMRAAFDVLGGQPPGLRLSCVNRIPHGRGLGSSAAAIVAGVELARCLSHDGRARLDDAGALALAARLEGHPDNVAACLLGGLTIAWTSDGTSRAVRLQPQGFQPVLFIPSDQSATHTARAALPPLVPHADAAFNSARSALLTVALTGRPELLWTATEDRLHQHYRAASMPASSSLLAELRAGGVAAVISGAGSSVLALAVSPDQVATALTLAPAGWECAPLQVAEGARCSVA